MSYIWSYIKKQPQEIALVLLGAIMFVSVNLGLPTLLARIINDAVVNQNFDTLWESVGLMFVLIILGLLASSLSVYASTKLTTNVVRQIRNDLYGHIQHFSHEDYNYIGVPSMITRLTSDAFVVMQFTEILLRAGTTPILMFFGSVMMIIVTAPSLSWIFLIAVPAILFILWQIIKKSRPLSNRVQVILDQLNLYARENLTGLRVIRAFAREEYQQNRFEGANKEFSDTAIHLNKLMGATMPLFSHVMMWTTVIVLWFSLGPVAEQVIGVGTVVAFAEYSFQALFSIMIFAQIFMMAPRAIASARRLEEIISINPSIGVNLEGVQETETQGVIEFRDVTFAYPDEEVERPVLHNISFTARPGETVAFIGSTGSGKTTLIRLIPRFFDVTLGRVLIDGIDVRKYSVKHLREKIGFVPQKANLFSGTVRENLQFGQAHADDDTLEKAIDIAQAKSFVHGLEEGFDSYLAEGGSNLSGGQKQRLSIARTIVKNPSIYIFDDSFSALDYKTDAVLRKRLKEVTEDATVLIVAQRISSIMDADQIIILDKGEIVGRGTHRELMKTNKIYQEIAESQSNIEEERV